MDFVVDVIHEIKYFKEIIHQSLYYIDTRGASFWNKSLLFRMIKLGTNLRVTWRSSSPIHELRKIAIHVRGEGALHFVITWVWCFIWQKYFTFPIFPITIFTILQPIKIQLLVISFYLNMLLRNNNTFQVLHLQIDTCLWWDACNRINSTWIYMYTEISFQKIPW